MIGQTVPTPTSTDPETMESIVPEVASQQPVVETPMVEIGGREGLDPARYGDWEKNGRCIDF